MAPILSRVLGAALRAGIAAILLVRRPRPIHAHGVVFDGDLTMLPGRALSGIEAIDRPTAERVDIVARVSRAVGLPSVLPDVHGLALRWTHETGTTDLELSSSGLGVPWRHILRPHRLPSSAPMSSLLPYRSTRGPVLLCVRTLPPRSLPAGLDALRQAVAEEPWALRLYFATPRGRWHPFAEVRLREARIDDDPHLRFDIDRHPLVGAETYPWVRALRQPGYRLAQDREESRDG